MRRLGRSFFLKPTVEVAKSLLGKVLVRVDGAQKRRAGIVVETEAYLGIKDKASHSYGGKVTSRNQAEYLIGGCIYIYLCYGMYWQLNITTREQGNPECVLIRALEPVEGIEKMKEARRTEKVVNLTNGPGKLCQALELDRSFYGLDVCHSDLIYFLPGTDYSDQEIVVTKRIGIDYAEEWKDKSLRFYLKDNRFVSRK